MTVKILAVALFAVSLSAGVLECWILLNSGEQGVGFDYPAYRQAHRAELIAYIDRYLIPSTPR